jgi:four helix bundle protein
MNQNIIQHQGSSLPHHRLLAYGKALELLAAVRKAQIRDAKLRDEAVRAAKSTCLNCAEGAGRVTRADKARAYAIARGECVECVAGVEIAAASGDARSECAREVAAIGNELYLMLSALIR